MKTKIALLIALTIPALGSATITQYNTLASWQAATGEFGPANETFEGFVANSPFRVADGAQFLAEGMSIVEQGTPSSTFSNLILDDFANNAAWLHLDSASGNDTHVKLTFLNPVSAWGARVITSDIHPLVKLDLFAGDGVNPVGTPLIPLGDTQFIGFQATGGMSVKSLLFRANGDDIQTNFLLDDFRLVEVPEPATYALLSLALGSCIVARRRTEASSKKHALR